MWESIDWCAPSYGQLPREPWFGERMALHASVVGGQQFSVLTLLDHMIKLYKDRNFSKVRCFEPWQRPCDSAILSVALMLGYETLHEDPWEGELLGRLPRLQHRYKHVSGAPFTHIEDRHPNYIILHSL